MPRSKRKHTDQDPFRVVEFSQGKPNEISFNVLDNKAASASEEKRGFFSRFGRRGSNKHKGSYEGFGDSIALGTGDANATDVSQQTTPVQQAQLAQLAQQAQHSQQPRNSNQRGKHAQVAQPKQRRFGRRQQEETPFLPNASSFSAEHHAEIGRRQKRRARARFISGAIVAVIAIALLAALGTWGYQEYEKNRSNRELIDQACLLIEQSDHTLVAIDEFFGQTFADDTIVRAEQLQAQIPSALAALQDAKKYAERADQAIEGTTADKEAAQCAYNTIVSRETMFEVANQKLALDINAKKSLDGMNLIETNINDSQYLLAQAASTVQQTSPETVAQSTEWLTEAQTKLQEAQDTLNEIIERFPNGNFTVYADYLAKRLEEIHYGLLSNEAILIQDRKTAEANNELYNQADRASVEIAKTFPETFAQPLIDAYTQETTVLDNQFSSLRADIGAYDSVLRDYLGNETKK